MIKYGLKCDTGLTSDAARVLRVPGTLNYKTTPPKPVKLRLLEELDYDFGAQLALLPSPTAQNEKAENVAGANGYDDAPLDYANLFKDSGCPYFRDAWTTGGKEHSQGGSTFGECADRQIETMLPSWRNDRHAEAARKWRRPAGDESGGA